MKKLVVLPALIASIATGSLCASLLALTTGISICTLGYAFIAALPTPPPLPPSALSTEASVPVTNAELHVSFKQPEGWVLVDSGIERNRPWPIRYAIYGLKKQPDTPTLKITYGDSGSQTDPGDEDILVSNEVHDARYRGEQVVGELRERIDSLPAGGVRYVAGRKVGFTLVATQPRQTNYFEWISDVKYLSQLEQIYRNMLPTIKIAPPVP